MNRRILLALFLVALAAGALLLLNLGPAATMALVAAVAAPLATQWGVLAFALSMQLLGLYLFIRRPAEAARPPDTIYLVDLLTEIEDARHWLDPGNAKVEEVRPRACRVRRIGPGPGGRTTSEEVRQDRDRERLRAIRTGRRRTNSTPRTSRSPTICSVTTTSTPVRANVVVMALPTRPHPATMTRKSAAIMSRAQSYQTECVLISSIATTVAATPRR